MTDFDAEVKALVWLLDGVSDDIKAIALKYKKDPRALRMQMVVKEILTNERSKLGDKALLISENFPDIPLYIIEAMLLESKFNSEHVIDRLKTMKMTGIVVNTSEDPVRSESNRVTLRKFMDSVTLMRQGVQIFTDICPRYMKELCFQSGCSRNKLTEVAQLLLRGDYPKRSKEDVHFDCFQVIRLIFPDVDPTYLKVEYEKVKASPRDLDLFIETLAKQSTYLT